MAKLLDSDLNIPTTFGEFNSLAKKISDELRLSPKTTNPSKILHFIAQGLNAENGNRLKAELDSYNFLSQISIQVKHPEWATTALDEDPSLDQLFIDATPDAIALGVIANVIYECFSKQSDSFHELNFTAEDINTIQEKIIQCNTHLPKEQIEFIDNGVFSFSETENATPIKVSGFRSLLNLFLQKLLPLMLNKLQEKQKNDLFTPIVKLVRSENDFDLAIQEMLTAIVIRDAKDILLFEVWHSLSFDTDLPKAKLEKSSFIDSAIGINKTLNQSNWPLRGRHILLAEYFYKKTNIVIDPMLCQAWLGGSAMPNPEQMQMIDAISNNSLNN